MPDTTTPRIHLIHDLGIVGWYQQEAAIIAALATESPLLLIGPHGTGKSLLLERLAETMQLRFRHYNASILNFDDLIGFPVPDKDRVKYLRTPVDAWDAEAIFIDEISRCRPDLQNRLFPLIHEKKLQGARLENLRYRWSAMNPPPDEHSSVDECYHGAEPLDPALADRFSWVIPIPVDLQVGDRFALIRGPAVKPEAGKHLLAAIQHTKSRLHLSKQVFGENILRYVDAVSIALGHSKIKLSNRRLRMLYDNILALLATQRFNDPAEASFVALKYSIPQRAQRTIDPEVIIRAHRAALRVQALPIDDICRQLLQEADPIERIAIALQSDDEDILVATLLDARAALTWPQRLALSTVLFPLLVEHRPTLPAILFEAMGEDVSQVESLVPSVESIATHSKRYQIADSISKACAQLEGAEVWIEDVLWTAFRQEELEQPMPLIDFARSSKNRLAGVFACQ